LKSTLKRVEADADQARDRLMATRVQRVLYGGCLFLRAEVVAYYSDFPALQIIFSSFFKHRKLLQADFQKILQVVWNFEADGANEHRPVDDQGSRGWSTRTLFKVGVFVSFSPLMESSRQRGRCRQQARRQCYPDAGNTKADQSRNAWLIGLLLPVTAGGGGQSSCADA
jgi:hypothetical protein